MLPKVKKGVEKEVEKPKEKDEIFSTFDPNVANSIKAKGFHVEQQIIVDKKLLFVFKESKQQIEKAK